MVLTQRNFGGSLSTPSQNASFLPGFPDISKPAQITSILFKFLAVLLTVGVLFGCKTELMTEIFLRDILDVAETGESVSFPSRLMIPISNQDNCEKDRAKILGVLGRYATLKFLNCESLKGEMFDAMNVEVETLITKGSATPVQGLFGVALVEQDGKLVLQARLSENVDRAVKELDDLYIMTSVNLNELQVRITINNDTRQTRQVSVDSAFVDGQPVDESAMFTLKRRGAIELKPSDVRTRAMVQTRKARIATVAL
ncbi:MAG: hypothetical protein CL923_02630 [Deltaproteobacteria bacterium]|jgi:hypothetical protein|nr:hypothetical protein [Deltaproteobacteria bacterium]